MNRAQSNHSNDTRIACLDVQYFDTYASVAAVTCLGWDAAKPQLSVSTRVPLAGDYQAGEFYKRELAPLLTIIKLIPQPVDVYVIDAYCQLDAEGSPGLGADFYEAIDRSAPVIGVAKNRFRHSEHAAEVLRGNSSKPLFVTSVGLPHTEAAACIAAMAGDHRMPVMLKAVDGFARIG